MRVLQDIWTYFGQSQSVSTRVLHFLVLVLVAGQLVTSDFVRLDQAHRAGHFIVFPLGTWAHVLPGLLLAVIATIFVIKEFYIHGLKYFFPYMWGDLSQLKTDLQTLADRKLPAVAPCGLPAIVQGLGLWALAMTLLSGLMWLFFVLNGSGPAHTAIELHGFLTGVVIAYLVGHGGMGVLHIFLWFRSRTR